MQRRLTEDFARTVTCPQGRSRLTVRDDLCRNLALRVRPGGARTWVAMVRTGRGAERTERIMTIGPVGKVSLSVARTVARRAQALAVLGVDPERALGIGGRRPQLGLTDRRR